MKVSSSSSSNSRICSYGHAHDTAKGVAGQHANSAGNSLEYFPPSWRALAGNRMGNRVGCGHDGSFADRRQNLEGVSRPGTLLADISKGDWLRADLLPDSPHSLASATVRLAQTVDAFERGHQMTVGGKKDQIKQLKADMACLDERRAPNHEHLQLMHAGLERDCSDQLRVEQEKYTGPRGDQHLSRTIQHLENESARVSFGRGDRALASQAGDFDWGKSSQSEQERAWARDMDRAREIVSSKQLSERERENELQRETERKREEDISRLELELRQSERDRSLSREHNRKGLIQCGMNQEVINATNGFGTQGACASSRVCACAHMCTHMPLFLLHVRVISFLPGLT